MKMLAMVVMGGLLMASLPAARGAEPAPSGLIRAKLGVPFPPGAGMLDYADGLDHLEAFDLAAAETSFTKALTESPGEAQILLARGVCLALDDAADRIALGVKDIEAAVAAAPRDPAGRRMLAMAMVRSDRNARLPEFHRFSSSDRFDRLVQSALRARGAGDAGPGAESDRRLALTVARVFVMTRKQTPDVAKVLFARALDRRKAGDLAGARSDLSHATEVFPLDAPAMFYYSAALTSSADFERARQVASAALCREPTLVQGYTQRALAAARMGGIARARLDLQHAREIDPSDSHGEIKLAEKFVAEDERSMPAEEPAALFEAMLTEARKGVATEALAPLATKTVREGNAKRLLGDEVYQEKLRQLQWAVLAAPGDADRVAKLGRYLLDEVDVRGEWVDPDQTWEHYRLQTPEMRQWELAEARRALGRALEVDGKNIVALVGMAHLEYRNGQWGAAEQYARDAMAVRPGDVEVLDLMSRLISIAAGQALAAEMAAVSSSRSEIWGSDRVWVRETKPTPAGYAYATAMDQKAGDLLALAKQYTQAALKNHGETTQYYDYVGTFAFREKRYGLAAQAYEKAVAASPNDIGFRYGLANAYSALNDFSHYLTQVTAGRNLEQTSIGAQLLSAWQEMGRGNFAGADAMFAASLKIDPADSRLAAYMGAVAEGRGNAAEALACFRVALALELARLKGMGVGAAGVKFEAPLKVNDIGRAVALRMAVARLLRPSDPGEAARYCMLNAEWEARLTPAEMLPPVAGALLPTANVPHSKQEGRRRAPRGGELFRTNRGMAGTALYEAGKVQEAAEQFRRASHYGGLLVLAGASPNEEFDTVGWPSGADPAVARECLMKVDDEVEARRWATRPRAGNGEKPEPRRPPETPTRPPPQKR